MSLFGDDPASVTPTRRPKASASLFADDDGPASAAATAGSTGTASSPLSSWTPVPSAKRASMRGAALLRSLVPAGQAPDAYADMYDRMGAESKGIGGVDAATVRDVLLQSGVDDEVAATIRKAVMPDESRELGRGEVNVLLAMIGLAQEGEEVTLDGVDERKRNLPIPTVGSYSTKSDANAHSESAEPQETANLVDQDQAQMSQKTSPAPGRLISRQSYGYADSDPWAAPDMHKGHSHPTTNGTGVASTPVQAPPQKTTSTFTTTSHTGATDTGKSAPTRESASRDSAWGAYNTGSGESFRDSGLGGFGDSSGGDGDGDRNNTTVGGAFIAPRITPTGTDEVITVQSLPEKEGVFLFQHRNYQITSARRGSKVIRRYSDFAWLLDCLHKRYPFRQLPLLPPKRVATTDSTFVEKRRRGLARFLNALVRHPVMSQEQLVIMFLTVPTELAVWRKQASISVQEEFAGKLLPATLEDALAPNLQELFDRVRTGVRRSAEQYINLCTYAERLAKRHEGIAAESARVSGSLRTLTDVAADTYAADAGDILPLNMGMAAASKHYAQAQALLDDEARAWDEGALEDLKRQRDAMVSVREMFERRDRYDRDNIPFLERRIKTNEERLGAMRARPDGNVKPGEAEKLEDAIHRDKKSIVDQHARGVFVKECIRDEIMYFQSTQFQVSRLHQDWAAERVKYAELLADNWRALADEVESMPLGE